MQTAWALALCTLAALHAHAQSQKRCTYDAAGDLVGHEVKVTSTFLQPTNKKVYQFPISPVQGCSLNGVSAKVCDVFSPEVVVQANRSLVTVHRLGPRLHPLTLDVTVYCDPPE